MKENVEKKKWSCIKTKQRTVTCP